MAKSKKWYAVLRDREDNDWGTGSFRSREAKRMLKNYPEGKIAIIDISESDTECIGEIKYTEIYG